MMEMSKDHEEIQVLGDLKVIINKDENMKNMNSFLATKSSKEAIGIAHRMQVCIFFNQPIVSDNYIGRNWYGGSEAEVMN